MRRVGLFILLSWMCTGWPVIADAEPVPRPLLRVELESSVAVPGQVIVLEVTILVPTWMPKPPEFPTFELPDVRVLLPEGASRPTAERIGRETWSGVTRAYQLFPMVVGRFRIPPQTVTVTFADPETVAPLVATLRMEELIFEGRAPIGAQDLDPFIAATALTLEQEIEGEPKNLEPGAAFTRIVTARLTGASPIFLPPLIPALRAEGLSAYPKEPVFSENIDRGVVSGQRVERVTYVAEAGGRFDAAPVRLRWWNLRTKEIEVAEIPILEIESRGPPPVGPPRELTPWLWLGGLFVGLLGVAARWLWPRIAKQRRRRREERQASESFAFDQVTHALRARRFGDAVCAVERWSARLHPVSEVDHARFFEPLEPLAAVLYRGNGSTPSKAQWSKALSTLREARRGFLASSQRHQTDRVLPALNPGRVASSLR